MYIFTRFKLFTNLRFPEIHTMRQIQNRYHEVDSALRVCRSVTRLTVNRSLHVRKQIQLVCKQMGPRQSMPFARTVDVLNYFSSQFACEISFSQQS